MAPDHEETYIKVLFLDELFTTLPILLYFTARTYMFISKTFSMCSIDMMISRWYIVFVS